MSVPQSNPIYARLTRGHAQRGPRARAALVAGALLVSALIGSALHSSSTFTLPWIFGRPAALVSSLALIGLAAGFAQAAALTARFTTDEDYALVIASAIPARDIVRGLIDALNTRLDVLWVIGVWAVPAAWIGATGVAIQWGLATGCPNGVGCAWVGEDIFLDALFILPWLASSVGMMAALARLAITGGVWAGIRWGRAAPVGIGGLLLGSFAAAGVLNAGLIFAFWQDTLIGTIAWPVANLVVLAAAMFLAGRAHAAAVRLARPRTAPASIQR